VSSTIPSPLTPLTSLTQNPAFLKRANGINGTHIVPNGLANVHVNGLIGPASPSSVFVGAGGLTVTAVPGMSNGNKLEDALLSRLPRLGNLFLSSCPGKKGKLHGYLHLDLYTRSSLLLYSSAIWPCQR
jgi:hypothetical protein